MKFFELLKLDDDINQHSRHSEIYSENLPDKTNIELLGGRKKEGRLGNCLPFGKVKRTLIKSLSMVKGFFYNDKKSEEASLPASPPFSPLQSLVGDPPAPPPSSPVWLAGPPAPPPSSPVWLAGPPAPPPSSPVWFGTATESITYSDISLAESTTYSEEDSTRSLVLQDGEQDHSMVEPNQGHEFSEKIIEGVVEKISEINYENETEDDVNYRLPQKLKEVNERITNDRLYLAVELSPIIEECAADRKSLNQELRTIRTELHGERQRLEKYQANEHRLLARIKDLAECNVFLQREALSFSEKEDDATKRITSSEKQLGEMSAKVGELTVQNEDLQRDIYDLKEKYRIEKEAGEIMQINIEKKEKECKDLHRSVTRLHRTCNEQEFSIDGLRILCGELGKNKPTDNFGNELGRLKSEQIRLTGVEQSLRKEVEGYRVELDSIRQENMMLKGKSKGGYSSFKLECELRNRVKILQNEGLSLLVNNFHFCDKLLKEVKGNGCRNVNDVPYDEDSGLHVFVMESEANLQGFVIGIEKFWGCLQSLTSVLQDKSPQSQSSESDNRNDEANIEAELRAETLLTKLLKERLYHKVVETERFEAELAAAVRENDILMSETYNAHHELKNLKIQVIRKEQDFRQLENEVANVSSLLAKVEEERDRLRNEVQEYNEENVLLNSHIKVMKEKIEDLDEDVMFKEGQITILKDSIRRPSYFFGSPDCIESF